MGETMTLSRFKIIAVLGVVWLAPFTLFAQTGPSNHRPLHGFFAVAPWKEGTHADAIRQSLAATTVPMSSYSIMASKDGNSYSGTIVGGSPWGGPTTTQLSAVVVPLKISIGTATFNPTTTDSCNNVST